MNDTDYIFHQFKRGNLKPFFREMYSGVMIYAIKVLGDEFAFLAEDVVQEAIITTYNRREDIGSVESWRGFMLSCVRFNAIAILRKHSRHLLPRRPRENRLGKRQFISHDRARGSSDAL